MKKKPRIVVLDLRPLQIGYAGKGIGRYTAEVAPRLAALLESRAKPSYRVFSLIEASKENPLPAIPVLIQAPPWRRMWLWDQCVLPFLLLRRGARVFHNFAAVGPLDRVSFPRLAAFRSIATVYDWHMFAEDATDLERFYRSTRRIRIQRAALPKTRAVVTISEQVKVETIMRAGVDSGRIAVIPPGGDHLDRAPVEDWTMENFALSVGDTPNKNLAFARDVLALLRARFIHLNWVVVGSRARVQEQLGIAEGGIPAWITVLEKPTDALVKACYLKALCLLYPSTREGFGIPLLEAMRLGCPVLANNVDPMKSLIAHPPSLMRPGLREAWCEAVRNLLQNPEARREAAEAGRRRAATFTWDATAAATAALYP